ncbi:hypothetical protein P7C73_g123, partial [Tremellales sp. Uapishka_1]
MGYWAWTASEDYEPYIQGQLPYLERALNWSSIYGLDVMMDLHGLPGGQNGQDNQGIKGPIEFPNNSTNMDRAIAALKNMTAFVTADKWNGVVKCIELTNEPYIQAYSSAGMSFDVLADFYVQGYNAVRASEYIASGANEVMVPLTNWEYFWSEESLGLNWTNYALDTHSYDAFNGADAKTEQEHLDTICSLSSSIQVAQTKYPVIVGEFALGTETYCTDYTACVGQTLSNMIANLTSNETSMFLREFWEVQADVYELGAGWIFWSHRNDLAAPWSWSQSGAQNWIPTDPTEKMYVGPLLRSHQPDFPQLAILCECLRVLSGYCQSPRRRPKPSGVPNLCGRNKKCYRSSGCIRELHCLDEQHGRLLQSGEYQYSNNFPMLENRRRQPAPRASGVPGGSEAARQARNPGKARRFSNPGTPRSPRNQREPRSFRFHKSRYLLPLSLVLLCGVYWCCSRLLAFLEPWRGGQVSEDGITVDNLSQEDPQGLVEGHGDFGDERKRFIGKVWNTPDSEGLRWVNVMLGNGGPEPDLSGDVSMCPYNQTDTKIHGFIGTHQPAIWMGESGPAQISAGLGRLKTSFEDRGLHFRRENEYASQNYYSNLLEGVEGQIGVEMSASSRVGHMRFRFDSGRQGVEPNIVVQASRESVITSKPHNLTFPQGEVKVDWERNEIYGWNDERQENIDLEIPDGQTLEKTSQKTRKSWTDKLDSLKVTGATPSNLTVLYTSFAHTLVYPYEISEYSGSSWEYYSGYLDRVVDGISYSGYSIWDTFRAETAWLILLAPERVGDMIQSMLEDYRQGGWLPMWKNLVETNIMVGTHSDSIIAQAMKAGAYTHVNQSELTSPLGVKGFDEKLAWEAVRKNAMTPPDRDTELLFDDREEHTPQEARAGLTEYMSLGYVAADLHTESGSRTLDYAYDDWAASIVALHVGAINEAESLATRSKSYRNMWNRETGFMEAKNSTGVWAGERIGWTEGDHWAYSFDVMHDVAGLIELVGGKSKFVDFLDRHFDGNHNLHTNEPSHHIPYLYAFADAAYKTQERVLEVGQNNYNHTARGLSGNEDCGQMSSWYLFSAMGFYPVDPASATYVIGTPFFDRMSILFPGASRPLSVTATGASSGLKYIKSLRIDGTPYESVTISHQSIKDGGDFVFAMVGEPQTWGKP